MAAKVKSVAVVHDTAILFQAYCGSSLCVPETDGGTTSGPCEMWFRGAKGLSGDVISAVPGILAIDPGTYTWVADPTDPYNYLKFAFKATWDNYVKAAYDGLKPYGDLNSPLTDSYYIKNVVLMKKMPPLGQGFSFPGFQQIVPLQQQGSQNIRLWWPLMYELPGTEFTLTISYGTKQLYDDGGIDELGRPNGAQYMHTEVWKWKVVATLDSMINAIKLFHELPAGTCQVPLISADKYWYFSYEQAIPEVPAGSDPYRPWTGSLYQQLISILEQAIAANGDTITQGRLLEDFELVVQDNLMTACPVKGAVAGPNIGIAQADCNPAAYKLLVDAEYVANNLGAFQDAK